MNGSKIWLKTPKKSLCHQKKGGCQEDILLKGRDMRLKTNLNIQLFQMRGGQNKSKYPQPQRTKYFLSLHCFTELHLHFEDEEEEAIDSCVKCS